MSHADHLRFDRLLYPLSTKACLYSNQGRDCLKNSPRFKKWSKTNERESNAMKRWLGGWWTTAAALISTIGTEVSSLWNELWNLAWTICCGFTWSCINNTANLTYSGHSGHNICVEWEIVTNFDSGAFETSKIVPELMNFRSQWDSITGVDMTHTCVRFTPWNELQGFTRDRLITKYSSCIHIRKDLNNFSGWLIKNYFLL